MEKNPATLLNCRRWMIAIGASAMIVISSCDRSGRSEVSQSAPTRNTVVAKVSDNKSDWSPYALLIIDMQQDFCNPNLVSQKPSFPENVKQLLAFARSSGIEVIHIRSEFDSDLEDCPNAFKVLFANGIPCVRGSDGAKPITYATEQARERVFHKHSFDGFSNKKLADYLRQQGKQHLLIAGVTTDTCVLSTAFGAINGGFLVSLVDDCCLGHEDLVHRFVIERYAGFIFDAVDHGQIEQSLQLWQQRLDKLERLQSGKRG